MKIASRAGVATKRASFAAVLLAGALALTACSGGAITETTLELEQPGVTSEITFTAKGDTVTEQTTKTELNYEALGLENGEPLRAQLEPLAAQYEGVEGVTHNIDFGETAAVETISVDYSKVDAAELAALPGSMMNEQAAAGGNISLKKSVDIMLESGFTEVK